MTVRVSNLPDTPVELVRFYLSAMQDRDSKLAADCLHPEFEMTFPGGVVFTELSQLLEWATPRYKSIGKRIESCELALDRTHVTNQSDVVWCYGTLYGQWPNGDSFEGVRFVDRFTVLQNKLLNQQVWNDLAEVASQK